MNVNVEEDPYQYIEKINVTRKKQALREVFFYGQNPIAVSRIVSGSTPIVVTLQP